MGADQRPVAVQGLTFLSLGSHCPMQNIRIVCSILTTLTGRGSSNPSFLPRFGGCILQLEEYQILNRQQSSKSSRLGNAAIAYGGRVTVSFIVVLITIATYYFIYGFQCDTLLQAAAFSLI